MTPSAMCMRDLRLLGYVPWVVEATIAHFKRDLFNCIDILALKDEQTLAIQVTSGANHAHRSKKVRESMYLGKMLQACWNVEVWSYSKTAAGTYKLRREGMNPGVLNVTPGVLNLCTLSSLKEMNKAL